MNAANVLMILGSALFIEGAVRLTGPVRFLCAMAAAFLIYTNTKQATRTLSVGREAVREVGEAASLAASHLASQRSRLETRREAQVSVAGEEPSATVKSKLEALKVGDARWQSSKGCTSVTTSTSYCREVRQMEGVVAAAIEREKIDADLANLPVPKFGTVGESQGKVADPYVANMASLIELYTGVKTTADRERLIAAEDALSRAFAFEVLAALGPTSWLAFLDYLMGLGAAVSSVSTRWWNMRKESQPVDTSTRHAKSLPPEVPKADHVDRWIADELERHDDSSMTTAQMRESLEKWCALRGIEPRGLERIVWQKLGKRFLHDRNGGRPRYLHVRPKRVPPGLQLVA